MNELKKMKDWMFLKAIANKIEELKKQLKQ